MSDKHIFEVMLERDGFLVSKTNGESMRPLFRQNRDLVTVRPKNGRLKKYDVPLYRNHKGGYLLHRIIRVTDTGYIIRGDNTYVKEVVPEEDIVGVLTEFTRKNKHYTVENKGYKLYSRVWNFLYPLRSVTRKPRDKFRNFRRKLKGS
jgi:hypothetical protein